MKYIVCIGLLFLSLTTWSQKEDYVWFVSSSPNDERRILSVMIDWKKGRKLEDKVLAYGIGSTNASICDKDGNLLFWSNGCAVMNREQEVMPHGDTLNWDQPYQDLFESDCINGYIGVQDIQILPDPGNAEGYYIFHKTIRYFGPGEERNMTRDLRFSYVDMTLDGGKGDVVFYDSILYDAPVTYTSLEAIYDANGKDWWLLQPVLDDSLLLTYHITKDGIERYPDQNTSLFYKNRRSASGTMRFSPDGRKLAYYIYFQNLHVYDFNRATGKISNHRKVTIFDDAEEMPNNKYRFGSVEWSPNSRFMYVAVRDSLFQVDSWEEDMEAGIRLIDVYNETLDPFPTSFFLATLAPDCKIYICSTNGGGSIHVINNPNALGIDCNFVQNGLVLPHQSGGGKLPLFPRFRVDAEEKCDSSITSVFGAAVYYRKDLRVFPNPTAGRVSIALPDAWQGGSMLVYDVDGQVVSEQMISPYIPELDMDFSYFPPGVYQIELYPEENREGIFYGTEIEIIK